ncbi:aldo/keto reductase [Thioalkalivibrio sp.]|uniref:aldo/keto reductase n=1 Tax=Thioalkalivibrio sp. TaxID=2093813 RepID=UPI0035626791
MELKSTVTLHTGRRMPVFGLGTWELTRDTAGTVERALELGYRMIDTAVDYGSQPGIGEALGRTAIPREEIFLVAKVEENDQAYEATRRYLDEMRQDYADLMLIHRPPRRGVGTDLWEGLVRAREDGLVREIGISNYSIEQMDRLTEEAGESPVVNQIEWTPFGWSREMLDACRERRVVIQAWSPLTRARRLDDDTLRRIADRRDVTPAQVLLRWALQKETVPLPKANDWDHLVENPGALDIELDDDEMAVLDGLNEHWSAVGPAVQYL